MFQGTTEDTGRSRPTLLAVIMLGIFLLSVGIAWWISLDRERLVGEGERIVAQIHKSKLESFWHGGQQSYYLISEKQKTIGWRADFRIPREGGGFDGLLMEVIYVGNRPQAHVRRWQLDSTATKGWYRVGWHQAAEPIPSDKDLPPNFLPEGTLTLAARLVAQAKTQAFFKSVYINESGPNEIEGPQIVNIGLTNLIYKGQETLHEGDKPIQASVVEVRLGILGKERTETLYLATDGHVVLIARPDQTLAPTSREQLAQLDPDALPLIRQEAEDSRFDLNALKSAPRPSTKNKPAEEP